MTQKKLILSLCDASGTWSSPYEEDPAYKVARVDLTNGHDVRLVKFSPHVRVWGILAAPPCTHLCNAGSPSWRKKGQEAILEALAVQDACIRLVHAYKPVFWALENPPGRLPHWLGPCAWSFQPWEFGGWLAEGEKSIPCFLLPAQDAYSKKLAFGARRRSRSPSP